MVVLNSLHANSQGLMASAYYLQCYSQHSWLGKFLFFFFFTCKSCRNRCEYFRTTCRGY